MEKAGRPPTWQVMLAFAIIYFVWGSTFLAIRIGVHEVPPFLLAGIRFLVAGLVLFGWVLARGERLPTARQWGSAFILAVLIFALDYGLLFWAEQRVPSGIAAVMMATIPMFMALSEIVLLKTQRFTAGLGLALLMGIAGIVVLMGLPFKLEEVVIDRGGTIALIVASISWSVASSLTRKLPLPESKLMSSSTQMLAGGLLLLVVASALGEFHNFHFHAISTAAWFSLLYLIFAGSIVAFTAYVWLIHHESPTRVGTYAYVNPVVAVLLGHFLGKETLGLQTMLGTALVLVSVVVITSSSRKKAPNPTFIGAQEKAR